jgi:electron transfer flavoprotein beta subunit
MNHENTCLCWYNNSDLAWRMNEYDEYAVEQAVQLKEQVGEADVTVLSIGSDRVKEPMKKALAMGCDRGVHVVDEASFAKDPFEIASIIATFAKDKGFDMIFTGMQSQDRGSAQVGVLVAEMLGLASISTVVEFTFGPDDLSAWLEQAALPNPAKHHEGQEERNALCGGRDSTTG